MIERRKYVRLQAHLGVRYQAVGSGAPADSGRTLVRNMSCGGLCINIHEPVREGDLLRIELEMPHLESLVRAVAEVVWVFQSDKSRPNEVGLRFRDITDQDLHHVLEYVHTVGIG